MSRRHFASAVSLVWALTALLGGAATAQDRDAGTVDESALDARWVPWLGCWHLWGGAVRTGGPTRGRPEHRRPHVRVYDPGGGRHLFDGQGGERLLVERHLVADGAQHTVDEDGCLGWERSDWSADGHRLFTSGELRCGDAPTRTVTGVSIMASTSSWVDIQYVQYGDREQLEVRRYSPMPVLEADAVLGVDVLPFEPVEIRRARRASTETLGLADVTEANERTMPRVVEALLVETEPISTSTRMHSSRWMMPESTAQVIDLMVALSYPEYFVVERRNRGGSWSSGLASFGGGYSVYDPIWYGDLYPLLCDAAWCALVPRRLQPLSVRAAAASPFVVLPGKFEKNASGHAFAGRGYTRVSPKKVSAPAGKGWRGGSGSSARGGSGGGTGGGTATSGGYTSGGGGSSSGGRQAVPRRD